MINYDALNIHVLNKVSIQAINILDVGCGTGELGVALKEQQNQRKVYGITYSQKEKKIADQCLDIVWLADLNADLPQLDIQFDCIILSHVLEHTYQPAKILANLSTYLKDNGVVIVALPNIMFFKQRFEFLKGNFTYSPNGGMMDETHFRFFDLPSAQKMCVDGGFEIISQEVTGMFPLPIFRKISALLAARIDNYFIKAFPGLFGSQFVFTLKKVV